VLPGDFFHSFAATSIGGLPCAQYWVDLVTWEGVLNARQQVDPPLRAIVELGTFKGGFSYYLDMQARARGLEFHTYDVTKPEHDIPGFLPLDIYRYADDLGNFLTTLGPTALFCDGGNKPRELRTFPPYLAAGSIFAVHDWGTEMLSKDVPDFLEPIYEPYLDRLGSVTRWFKMKEEA
jgi:hypothetical protein